VPLNGGNVVPAVKARLALGIREKRRSALGRWPTTILQARPPAPSPSSASAWRLYAKSVAVWPRSR
jgi:hypothetical protein